jgi:hypothetical protein
MRSQLYPSFNLGSLGFGLLDLFSKLRRAWRGGGVVPRLVSDLTLSRWICLFEESKVLYMNDRNGLFRWLNV